MNPEWSNEFFASDAKDVFHAIRIKVQEEKAKRLQALCNSRGVTSLESLQWVNEHLTASRLSEQEIESVDRKITFDLVVLGITKEETDGLPLSWKLKMCETLQNV